jgi:hypothetical protein
MGPVSLDGLNHALDQIPRTTVRVGARELPAFRSLGIVGFHLGLLAALATALRAGVPVLDAVALSATAAASFFVWALGRRAVTGRETLVLLEHVWAAFAAVSLYLWAAGAPIVPRLDVLAVGLCAFLAAGRVGCLTVGCCHGQPSGLGIVYPRAHALPDRMVGVRLFPLPLVEVVALLGIGAVGYALAGGRAGTATVWVLAAYATVRFGTEALRGDRRPVVAGISVPRAMAVAQLGAALVASEAWLDAGGLGRRQVVALVPLAVVGVAGLVLDRRRRDPLATPAHLDETWVLLQRLAAAAPSGSRPPDSATTSRDLHVAASWCAEGLHASLSHPWRPVAGLPHALGLVPLVPTGTATHMIVPPPRMPVRPPGALGEPPAGLAAEERDAARGVRSYAHSERLVVAADPSDPSRDGYFGERSSV